MKSMDGSPRMELSQVQRILGDDVLCQQFKMYLETRCAEENLMFWVDVSRLRNDPPEDPSIEISRIVSKYLKNGSPTEINISHSQRNNLNKDLDNDPSDTGVFDKIQRIVERSLMDEFLLPFFHSKYYLEPNMLSPPQARRRSSFADNNTSHPPPVIKSSPPRKTTTPFSRLGFCWLPAASVIWSPRVKRMA